MKKIIFTLAILFLFTAQAYSYDYQLGAIEDAFSDNCYPTKVNNTDKLWVGATVNYKLVPPSIDGSYLTRTYLKFDLTSMNNIDNAFLYLYRTKDDWGFNDPDKGDVAVYRETEDWNETTLTWQNAPDFGNNVKGTTTYIDMPVGGWVSWNVSTFAQQAQGGDLSLVLATSEPFHIFDSSETSHVPFLGINAVTTVTPEPASMLLFGFGGLAMTFFKKKRK